MNASARSSRVIARNRQPLPDQVKPGQVTLGRITAHYGLNGWVKVHSDTQPRENITSYTSWHLSGHRLTRDVKVLEGRAQGKTIVARLAGVDTREKAEPLIGCDISVARADLPPTDDEEHYWADLVGMQVQHVNGAPFGTVARLFDTGANDVVVVRDERQAAERGAERGSATGAEILIPWVRPDVIVEVDKREGRIIVDWDPDF